MSDYIDVGEKIYIPLKPVIVYFHEKEEVELNAFQKFILEAVEENVAIDQMMDATQLTRNVIESELLQMELQKLLLREGDAVVLSELSKNILMISRSVADMNHEKKTIYINLITGEIEGYEERVYYEVKEGDLVMEEKIKPGDIVGIDIEDNISFFADYMSAFDTLSKDQVEKVLSSVYVEFREIDKRILYKPQEIHKMPCLIGDGRLRLGGDVYAEGKCSVIEIQVSTDLVEKYREHIKSIAKLCVDAPELISDSGKELAKEYENCEHCNCEKLTFIYDHESGKIKEGKYRGEDWRNKRTQLMLKAEKEIDDKIKDQIFDAARMKWNLTEQYHMKLTDIKEYIYKIGFSLEELRGNVCEGD